MHAHLDLTSLETYQQSCLRIAMERLSGYGSMARIAEAENDLNAYPNLDHLAEPRRIQVLDDASMDPADLDRARLAVLEGRVFWEHTAAGEATRLKLGTKYLIDPRRDLTVVEMAERLGEELGREVSAEEIQGQLDTDPKSLMPLSLGMRHMLQLAFDLSRLAHESGVDPLTVLARQNTLLILNEQTAAEIVDQVRAGRFFGFARERFLFMVQPAFPGITLHDGRFRFEPGSPKRLHNHGQLAMQETMDHQLFRLDPAGEREYLSATEFEAILDGVDDKISFNIEDLGYLTGSIDWPGLALALRLGAEGRRMVMEVVANNPDRPIKGGMAAFDEILGRNVMIESFQLKGLPNREIKFLNKNVNHYTAPVESWRSLKATGLPMPVAVKQGYLYFQPVQGDINFLVETAFVQRKSLKPIRAWKSAANTTEAVNAMWAQDRQPGFKAFAESVMGV